MATPIPTRKTSEHSLDEWNQAFRMSPVYQNFMARRGLPTDGRVRLSGSQQAALENDMRAAGLPLPSGMHIDQGGNLNQKNRLGRNIAIGAGIGLATVATLGAAGAFAGPALGGAGAAGGAGAGAAGAAGAGAGLGAAGIGTGAGLAGTSLGGAAAGLGGAGALAGTGIGTGAGLAGTALGGGAATLGGAGALAGTGIGTGAGLAATTLGTGAAGGGAAGGGSFLAGNGGRLARAAGTGLNALGAGLAGEREDENRYGSDRDRAQASIYGTQQQGLNQLIALQEKGVLDRAQLGINAPNARMQQTARGSLLANAQPARISGLPSRIQNSIPQLSGGLTPASLSPAARAAGAEMQRQALLALLSGSDVPAMPDYTKRLLPPPALSNYRGASAGETAAGIGGGILSGIGSYYGR